MNPELRQTLNTISRNLESANEAAQENIYTFTQLVIDPCVNGFKNCISDCTSACFPKREDRLRRHRARSRGRSDLHFDFYDDWEDEADTAYGSGSWGNDELDSLLAGRGSRSAQPSQQKGMSYGTRGRRPAHAPGEENPTIIPSSSYLGFLERFKWRPGARGVRYKPSAADLQEHPGNTSALGRDEIEPLIEDSDEDQDLNNHPKQHRRQRSDTDASRSTNNSLSSRGDLIMGDEEDDAQPLDDEFAVMLTRTNTSNSRRPGMSRKSTRTASGKSSRSMQSKRTASSRSLQPVEDSPVLTQSEAEPPSMAALQAEEEYLRREQEMEIEQKREAASNAAKERGLIGDERDLNEGLELKAPEIERSSSPHQKLTPPEIITTSTDSPVNEIEQRLGLASPVSTHGYNADSETEPFPSFPTTPTREVEQYEHPP